MVTDCPECDGEGRIHSHNDICPTCEQIRRGRLRVVFRIDSRVSAFYRWRRVGPRPHGETYSFDAHGLVFPDRAAAENAAAGMRRANAAQFAVCSDVVEGGVL